MVAQQSQSSAARDRIRSVAARAQSPGLARLKSETRTQGYVRVVNDIRNLRISFAALDADSTSAEIASYSARDARASGAETARAYAATMNAQHMTLRWEESVIWCHLWSPAQSIKELGASSERTNARPATPTACVARRCSAKYRASCSIGTYAPSIAGTPRGTPMSATCVILAGDGGNFFLMTRPGLLRANPLAVISTVVLLPISTHHSATGAAE